MSAKTNKRDSRIRGYIFGSREVGPSAGPVKEICPITGNILSITETKDLPKAVIKQKYKDRYKFNYGKSYNRTRWKRE